MKEFCPDFPRLARKILDLQKKALHVNSDAMLPPKQAVHINSGAIIFQSKHVGRHFCSDFQGVLEGSQRFCPDFRGFCLELMGFCPDFHQIKTFGGTVSAPAPPPPTPVDAGVS